MSKIRSPGPGSNRVTTNDKSYISFQDNYDCGRFSKERKLSIVLILIVSFCVAVIAWISYSEVVEFLMSVYFLGQSVGAIPTSRLTFHKFLVPCTGVLHLNYSIYDIPLFHDEINLEVFRQSSVSVR